MRSVFSLLSNEIALANHVYKIDTAAVSIKLQVHSLNLIRFFVWGHFDEPNVFTAFECVSHSIRLSIRSNVPENKQNFMPSRDVKSRCWWNGVDGWWERERAKGEYRTHSVQNFILFFYLFHFIRFFCSLYPFPVCCSGVQNIRKIKSNELSWCDA